MKSLMDGMAPRNRAEFGGIDAHSESESFAHSGGCLHAFERATFRAGAKGDFTGEV